MMKKIIVAVLVIGAVLGISYFEHNYTREECEVIQICDGIVTVVDGCGFTWDFEKENNDLEVGDFVTLKMFDNISSANIEDDVITKIIKE